MGIEGIADKVGDFNPDNIFDIFGAAGPKIMFVAKVIFWFAVFVLGAVLFYKKVLQYKISVTVKKNVSGQGLEIVNDRAKMVVDKQGKRKLQLWKTRNGKRPISCPMPESKYKSKEGKKDHYELWLDDNFQLHPIEHPDAPIDELLRIRPQERDAWNRFEDVQIMEKYKKQNMLDKYLPSGIVIMAMMTAFLIWFFAAKSLGAGMTDLAQQFAQIASSCTKLGP